MKRPTGVISAAIAEVVLSLIVLSLAITKIVALATYYPEDQSALLANMSLEAAIVCGLLAAFGLLTAVGLLRMGVWARYATLVLAGVVAIVGPVMILVFVMALTSELETTTPESTVVATEGASALLSLSATILGVLWLRYFNSRRIKAAFTQRAHYRVSASH
jgi:hypothetical protein